ncbi:MAG: ABC transporter permease [Akkermansiaceae bacterium]|nr:ABC transporter permease [Akkermansiaceae bacterium]
MSEEKKIKRRTSYFATLRTLYAKELKSYLCTPFGWVIMGCTMFLLGYCLQSVIEIMTKAATGESVTYYLLSNIHFWFYFIFIFPLITMRSFAEEERQGTLEGLLTAPVSTMQIVLGKYLATYTFYLLLWVPLLLYPWMSRVANMYTELRYGIVPEGEITYLLADWYGPLCILALSGAFFIALGLLCSAMTRSQIIAGILSTSLMISYYFMGRITELWGEFRAAPAFHYISCTEQVSSFSRGLLDTRPLVLYLSLTILTLALVKRVVDYRRWTR